MTTTTTSTTPIRETPAGHGYISDKDRYLARLKRIEGQARGIHRMIDEDTYCIDILTQISAVTAALENVALGLLDDHLKHCVTAAIHDGDARTGTARPSLDQPANPAGTNRLSLTVKCTASCVPPAQPPRSNHRCSIGDY